MNISYNWLKEFVSFNLSPDETAKVLTSIGLENGPIEKSESIKGGLEGLVIGKVLTCTDHPDSDHLHCTTVDVGEAEPLKIVCGAPNVQAGQTVVVATVGAKLYSGDEAFTIKKSKIRGQESFGMICAEDEIGVGTSHDGIIVLSDEVPVGTKAKDYYKIENDYILEVDITPNRIDAASHFGVARDLAAYLKTIDKSVVLKKPDVDSFQVDNTSKIIEVQVEDSEACPRYTGVTLTNVHVTESPKWLQERLIKIGLRPINNVVDVTNYLLHETGQPLHAFDCSKIVGNKIIVKKGFENQVFVTLDGVERKLSDQDLMICNAAEPMCIAGVFGGLDSGVQEHTTDVFIESAYFNPVSVRKTARYHGLNTDSSFRFERGVDPNNIIYVLKRAAMMIKEFGGGEISSPIVDVYPNPIQDFKVQLSIQKVHNLIGKEIEVDTIKSILNALEISISKEQDGVLDLIVPAYRVDVQRDVDVIEDILRIYGYNQVEVNTSLKSTISISNKPNSYKLQNLISEQLTANGYNEIMNNSLTASALYQDSTTFPVENVVMLMNPLSSDLNGMRQTLLFGGLESIAYNKNRKRANLKLYEFGNCYQYHQEKKSSEDRLACYTESYHLGIWMTGDRYAQNWMTPVEKSSVYELKAIVQNVFKRLGLEDRMIDAIEGSDDLFSHKMQYQTKNGKVLAQLGAVKSSILNKFDIDTPVFFADIEWNNVLEMHKGQKVRFTEMSKFPEVRRDLALLLDKQIRFEDIRKVAKSTEKKLLKDITLFDVYEGKNLPMGKKSYAVSFILQDENQTLNDKTIDSVMNKLIEQLKRQLNAELR
jgi:phenylalanyl-tRNA synthetase beta chain